MVPLSIDPRTVNEADFPYKGTAADKFCFVLNYALLAPSEYNSQPWLFKIRGNTLEMYADLSRRLPIVDPENRELLVSCGAAFYNLRLALHHFGYRDEILICFHEKIEEPLAKLRIAYEQPETPEENALFRAIPQRRSNRSQFEDRELPESELQHYVEIVGHEGVWLKVIQTVNERQRLADLILMGDRQQWANKMFRQELSTWLQPRESAHDGLPGYVHARGSIVDQTFPFVVRTFDLWREEAPKMKQLILGAPVLAVFGTYSDTVGDWFAVGQALERVLLQACTAGIQASFVNQAIEVPPLRGWLKDVLACEGYPQLVIRLGYGQEAPISPRRPVAEILLEVSKEETRSFF